MWSNNSREQRLRDDVVIIDTTAEAPFAPSIMAVGFGILTAVSLFRGAIRSTVMGRYYFGQLIVHLKLISVRRRRSSFDGRNTSHSIIKIIFNILY